MSESTVGNHDPERLQNDHPINMEQSSECIQLDDGTLLTEDVFSLWCPIIPCDSDESQESEDGTDDEVVSCHLSCDNLQLNRDSDVNFHSEDSVNNLSCQFISTLDWPEQYCNAKDQDLLCHPVIPHVNCDNIGLVDCSVHGELGDSSEQDETAVSKESTISGDYHSTPHKTTAVEVFLASDDASPSETTVSNSLPTSNGHSLHETTAPERSLIGDDEHIHETTSLKPCSQSDGVSSHQPIVSKSVYSDVEGPHPTIVLSDGESFPKEIVFPFTREMIRDMLVRICEGKGQDNPPNEHNNEIHNVYATTIDIVDNGTMKQNKEEAQQTELEIPPPVLDKVQSLLSTLMSQHVLKDDVVNATKVTELFMKELKGEDVEPERYSDCFGKKQLQSTVETNVSSATLKMDSASSVSSITSSDDCDFFSVKSYFDSPTRSEVHSHDRIYNYQNYFVEDPDPTDGIVKCSIHVPILNEDIANKMASTSTQTYSTGKVLYLDILQE